MAIRKALPAARDRLALCSVFSFDGAISQVERTAGTRRSRTYSAAKLVEFQMGWERRFALGDLAQRSAVPELTRFANAVVQATSLGVPL